MRQLIDDRKEQEGEQEVTTATAKTGRVMTQADKDTARLLEVLSELGGAAVGDDSIEFAGDKIRLPAHLAGPGGIERACKTLRQYEEQQEKKIDFSRTFPYRPFDGAAAFNRAMMRVFGTAGIGKSWFDFFGQEHRPQLISIPVGVNESMQVPWDEIHFEMLDADFEIGMAKDPNKGFLSHITVTAPRKHQARIEGFFRAMEEELKERSIYRGRAIDGSDNPGFWDEQSVDPTRCVYNDDTLVDLHANIWSVIDHSDQMRMNHLPLKRAFLLEGPYGTGKTQAGALTAQHAVAAGWTFILVRPEDSPLEALRTAQLYSPAVVWIEDADNLANAQHSRARISTVLDAMDNAAVKNTEVMVGFTTNFPDVIDKGMLRPGRIDAVIHLGAVAPSKLKDLVESHIAAALRPDIEYTDELVEAFDGYVPAFAVEAIRRAVRYSIAKNQGRPSKVTTADLVEAARGLRRQKEMMEAAAEGSDDATIDALLRRQVRAEMEQVNQRTVLEGVGTPFKVVDENGLARRR
jgi:transitional endoplasmic reticulum ATPase